GRCHRDSGRFPAPSAGSVPSAGLSPTSGAGPVVLPRDPHPARDRRVVGRHRSDPRAPGVGHDLARSSRRVDRRRRVFESLKTEALAAFDPIIGLDLDHVALDGSLHKAPCGGEGTGPNPTDRAKLGWKWSVAPERHGIPVGWAIDGANRNDVRMLEPTLDAVADAGLLAHNGPLHPHRGYDSGAVRHRLRAAGIDQFEIQLPGTKVPGGRSNRSVSDCDGSSKRPTRGGRTTASFAATPTAEPGTATPRSASPRRSSSSVGSSTGATDGAPRDAYPLRS